MKNNYYLKFRISEVNCEIRVNDIYFFSDKDGGNIASQSSINHLLINNENVFSATIGATSKALTSNSVCMLQVFRKNDDKMQGECKFGI